MRMFVHLYEVLGLDPEQEIITQEEIKKAYRKEAARVHPDKEGGSTEAMAEVNAAYKILGDPNLRAKYDATGDGDVAPEATKIPGIEFLHELLVALITPSPEGGGSLFAAIMGGEAKEASSYNTYENTDLLEAAKRLCTRTKESVQAEIDKHEQKAQQLESILERLVFKGKPGELNVVAGVLRARASSHRGTVTQGEEKLRDVDAVEKLLDKYDFIFEEVAHTPGQRGATVILDDPYVKEFMRQYKVNSETEDSAEMTATGRSKANRKAFMDEDEFNRKQGRRGK